MEAASVPVLEALGRVPKVLIALLLAVAVLVALLVDGWWAGLVLVPAVLFAGWLTYLTWPVLTGGQRVLRVVVLGLMTLAVTVRLGG